MFASLGARPYGLDLWRKICILARSGIFLHYDWTISERFLGASTRAS